MGKLQDFLQGERDRFADQLDQKATKKALRRAPNAPVMITKARTQREAQALQEKGWEVEQAVNTHWAGASLWTEFIMKKPNPRLTTVR